MRQYIWHTSYKEDVQKNTKGEKKHNNNRQGRRNEGEREISEEKEKISLRHRIQETGRTR